MQSFELILALLFAAVLLTAVARRVGAPYPTFLALGGAALSLLPGGPAWTLDPQLALALFVAPVLLDAAYDTSLRDLRDNWLPVALLALLLIGLTTLAVAVVARALVPTMTWPVAITLGAIVAPPDAAAATAVLRTAKLPHRLLTILEGESLLNDASALLIYRLAVSAAFAGAFSWRAAAAPLALGVIGSLAAGYLLAFPMVRMIRRVRDVPSSIILQFVTTFAVWILAERVGLSGILTIVAYAIAVARSGGATMPARVRVPAYAVWDTVVFLLNVLAFMLIGLQLGPLLARLSPPQRIEYGVVAVAVLGTVIGVRFAWCMSYNAWVRARIRRYGFRPRRPTLQPSVSSGLVISWCGMRGIVTLAAAIALPEAFPHRDLILSTAFAVVLGTLVLQGLSLRPLIARLKLEDGAPVEREFVLAREHAYRAALAALDGDDAPAAHLLRHEYEAILRGGTPRGDGEDDAAPIAESRRRAIGAARENLLELWRSGEIGDAAYHRLQEELDWSELSEASARE